MTKTHRDRFLLALALIVVVVGALTAPVAASSGALAGFGVAALTAVPALLLLGVTAYVVRSNDRQRARFASRPASHD